MFPVRDSPDDETFTSKVKSLAFEPDLLDQGPEEPEEYRQPVKLSSSLLLLKLEQPRYERSRVLNSAPQCFCGRGSNYPSIRSMILHSQPPIRQLPIPFILRLHRQRQHSSRVQPSLLSSQAHVQAFSILPPSPVPVVQIHTILSTTCPLPPP
jgi:hypothetical protein